MTQGNYHTAFQMGFRSFPWSAVAHPLIFVAIGLLLVRFLKDRKPSSRHRNFHGFIGLTLRFAVADELYP